MLYEVPPSRTGIGSVKTHSPTTSAAGSESTPLVRSWTSSMLMALLGAAATIAFLAAPASAVVMTSTQWNYDFNHLALTTGAAGSAESQASDFETQSTTTSPIGVSGNEGWIFSFSGTGFTKGTIYQATPTQKALSSVWYRTTAENYFVGRIGFATTGTSPVGNLKSLSVMPTASQVNFTLNGITGPDGGTSQGFQWQFRIQDGSTDRISIGPGVATRATSNPNWLFAYPGGTGGAAVTVDTGVPYFAGQAASIGLLVDLDNNTGSLTLNGSAVANVTNLNLVGTGGFNLRTLNNFNLFTKGGSVVDFGVQEVALVPEPSTLAFSASGLAAFLLASRFARRRRA